MLKRINVTQLTLGMYLKEFCGSWMEHPFFRSAFVLSDPKDIDAILASSIKEVWIDCDKGLDVAASAPSISEAQSQAQAEAQLQQPDDGLSATVPVSVAQEIGRAARICLRSKKAVVAMFEDVRMGKVVEAGRANEVVEEIVGSIFRNPEALISLARIKSVDDYTYMHCVSVSALMVALSKQLGFDVQLTHSAGLAGLLHDLGKAVMPLNLLKKPGRLTDAEFAIIKKHSMAGHSLMPASLNDDPLVSDVCLHHHEKIDGSGYPDHLKGDQISLGARMATVCDVYDAITSDRRYKAAWDPAHSLRKMAEWTGHFDPKVFHAFVKSVGIYPVGSLVRLSSGRIGVVLGQTAKSLTTPCVKVFFDTHSNLRIPPEVLDLANPQPSDAIEAREDPAKWNFPDLVELWSGLSATPW